MLLIRREQIDALRAEARAAFVDHLIAHLGRHFASPGGAASPRQIRALVEHGVERAAHHGLHGRSDVCKYVCLVAELGPDFDDRLPWARDILGDGALSHPTLRVDALCREALFRMSREEA